MDNNTQNIEYYNYCDNGREDIEIKFKIITDAKKRL